MEPFLIKFDPEINAEPLDYPAGFLDSSDYLEVMNFVSPMYQIKYYVCGVEYSYYPSAIATVLNDIHLEWDLIRSRVSHKMTLSGYSILLLDFADSYAYISDPIAVVHNPDKDPVILKIESSLLEKIFKDALDRVYSLIIQKLS